MADLSADQTPSIDQLVNAVGDLSVPDAYVPPRSGTYRTSKYPGFYTAGQTPSNNPNPVAGDNPVAAAPTGADPNAVATPSPGETGLSSITSNPGSAGDPSEGADQRQANALKDAYDTGYDTNPNDFAKAMNLAASFTGPTGLVGLGLGEAANALGVNPTGSAFDFQSNDNQRPGYPDAFKKAQADVLAGNPRYTTPSNLANQTQQKTRSILDAADQATGAELGGTGSSYGGATKTATPAPQDVTAANRATGFQKPASPSDRSVAPAQTTTDTNTGVSAPSPNGAVGSLIGAQAGGANGGGSGGGQGGSSNSGGGVGSNAGRRGFSKGGVVTMKPHHKAAAHKNHQMLKQVAAKTGKTVPAIVAMHKGAPTALGDRARLEAKVMQLACGGVAKKYAAGGAVTGNAADPAQLSAAPADAAASPQYNPPADQTAGNTDSVPAVLTPGETVLTKGASTQYDPAVKAALNDPAMADQINALIEQFLSDQGGQGGQPDEDAADGGADDASEGDGAGSGDASGLGVMASMRGIPSPKSKLASVTRAA